MKKQAAIETNTLDMNCQSMVTKIKSVGSTIIILLWQEQGYFTLFEDTIFGSIFLEKLARPVQLTFRHWFIFSLGLFVSQAWYSKMLHEGIYQ